MAAPSDLWKEKTEGAVLISSVTLAEAGVLAAVTIPAGYKDIVFTLTGRTVDVAVNDHIYLEINGDTALGNYSQEASWISGSVYDADEYMSGSNVISRFLGSTTAAGSAAGWQSALTCTFPDYSNSTLYKTWIVQSGHFRPGAATNSKGHLFHGFGNWENIAAITSIKALTFSGSNWACETTMSVWGMK